MSKSDWIEVGLRLLGVFFIVTGSIALWRALLSMAAGQVFPVDNDSLLVVALLVPSAEIVAGILLLYIRWPYDRLANPSPIGAYLEESLDQMECGELTVRDNQREAEQRAPAEADWRPPPPTTEGEQK